MAVSKGVNIHVHATTKSKNDPVNPSHYRDLGHYSALHVIHEWGLGFVLGQVLKYIQRAGRKQGESELVALKKARWYIQRELYIRDPENEADPADDSNRNGYMVK